LALPVYQSQTGCGVKPCQAIRPKGGFCYQKHGLLHDNRNIFSLHLRVKNKHKKNLHYW